MKKFRTIAARAAKRKGGLEIIEQHLAVPATKAKLRRMKHDRYLAQMAKNIFASGFRWKVVEAKWPEIEDAFERFDVVKVAALDEGDIERLMDDRRVIRHRGKLEAIRDNARFILDSGSFNKTLAEWPESEIVNLWAHLKTDGRLLGGNIGPRFLRGVGKDTFILAPDVVLCLIDAGVVDKAPTSKKALAATQDAFNRWHDETGRPLCQLSRIASMSIGQNYDVF